MFFLSIDDFFAKSKEAVRLSREEEIAYAVKMKAGDIEAREKIIYSYIPYVAAYIKRGPKDNQTLHTVYTCITCLEKCVDQFNFQQDNETFIHHLSLRLKSCTIKCFIDRRNN